MINFELEMNKIFVKPLRKYSEPQERKKTVTLIQNKEADSFLELMETCNKNKYMFNDGLPVFIISI